MRPARAEIIGALIALIDAAEDFAVEDPHIGSIQPRATVEQAEALNEALWKTSEIIDCDTEGIIWRASSDG